MRCLRYVALRYVATSNIELDLQSLFGLHVHSCTHWLRPSNSPAFGLIYSTRALLVSQDRRHLFVTPWFYGELNPNKIMLIILESCSSQSTLKCIYSLVLEMGQYFACVKGSKIRLCFFFIIGSNCIEKICSFKN